MSFCFFVSAAVMGAFVSPRADPFLDLFPSLLNEMMRMSLARSRKKCCGLLKPSTNEVTVVKEILRVFGEASGLVTNINKCSLTPIRCVEQDLSVAQDLFPCNIVDFPCKYLGLPISIKKLPRSVFLELIDKVADKLPG
jgi:hypothetical protein